MQRQGAEWARTQPSPWTSMLPAFDAAKKINPGIEWMPWTLGYCRELCGAFAAAQ